jgi:hypothetical protein
MKFENKQNQIFTYSLSITTHIIFFFIAITFSYLYFQKIISPADLDFPFGGFNSVLSYSANKPYQFRILIPLIYRVISVIHVFEPKIFLFFYNTLVVYLLIISYYLFLSLYFKQKSVCIIFSIIIIYPIVWNYIILNEIFSYYDMTSILFFTIGSYFIAKNKFLSLLIIFFIGLFNKETIAYLVFSYMFFNYSSLFTKKVGLRTTLLVMIFAFVKILLYYRFSNNPGSFVELCYGNNIKIPSLIVTNILFTKAVLLNFGGMYILVILLFFSRYWKEFKTKVNKSLVYINFTFIPFLVLGFFIVYYYEVRVYAEIIPIITTLSIIYLTKFYKSIEVM